MQASASDEQLHLLEHFEVLQPHVTVSISDCGAGSFFINFGLSISSSSRYQPLSTGEGMSNIGTSAFFKLKFENYNAWCEDPGYHQLEVGFHSLLAFCKTNGSVGSLYLMFQFLYHRAYRKTI